MKDPVQERIEREISGHDVVLFMKGTPVFPQCGFSNLVVQVLSHLGVKFKGMDVLSDPAHARGSKRSTTGRQFNSSMPRRVHRRPRHRPRDVRNRRARSVAGRTRREDWCRSDLTVS